MANSAELKAAHAKRQHAYRMREAAKVEALRRENEELRRRIIQLEASIDPGDLVEPVAKRATAKRKLETA